MKMLTGALVGLVLLCGCSSTGSDAAVSTPTPTATPFDIKGSIVVDLNVKPFYQGKQEAIIGGPCSARDGYDDVREGTQVVVTDSTGTAVQLGRLQAGELLGKDGGDIFAAKCEFPFTVDAVPAGSAVYGLEVGTRGQQRYTEAELQSPVTLTLG
jgi:hypothetical protein